MSLHLNGMQFSKHGGNVYKFIGTNIRPIIWKLFGWLVLDMKLEIYERGAVDRPRAHFHRTKSLQNGHSRYCRTERERETSWERWNLALYFAKSWSDLIPLTFKCCISKKTRHDISTDFQLLYNNKMASIGASGALLCIGQALNSWTTSTIILSQDSRCPKRDLKRGHPK